MTTRRSFTSSLATAGLTALLGRIAADAKPSGKPGKHNTPNRGNRPAAAGSPAARANWTVMVYMSGDNNLETYVVRDLENELAKTGSTSAVQVVALADRGPNRDASRGDWKSTKLFHVTNGMVADASSALQDWGERDLGKPETLLRFVRWTKANYPADHYALYFWGHSWSWHPGYTMEDETSKSALNPLEIGSIQRGLGALDVVGYDSCNAGSIEVQALWRGTARVIVHSQEWVNWDGLEYDTIIDAINANPAMTADEVAIASCMGSQGTRERTYSAVALDDRWERLEQAVDRWAAALRKGLPKHRAAYDRALKATQTFVDAPMERDLFDLAEQIRARVDDPAIGSACQAVMDAVSAAVIAEWHKPMYRGAHGITIYVPNGSTGNDTFAYYKKLDFAKRTDWDQFLSAWIR